MLIPVSIFIEAARFSALFPQLFLTYVEFILAISSVHGLVIKTSLGIDIKCFLSEFLSINPKMITSALSPSTLPLEAEEFSLLSSEPIYRYTLYPSIFLSALELSKILFIAEGFSLTMSIFSATIVSSAF